MSPASAFHFMFGHLMKGPTVLEASLVLAKRDPSGIDSDRSDICTHAAFTLVGACWARHQRYSRTLGCVPRTNDIGLTMTSTLPFVRKSPITRQPGRARWQ